MQQFSDKNVQPIEVLLLFIFPNFDWVNCTNNLGYSQLSGYEAHEALEL